MLHYVSNQCSVINIIIITNVIIAIITIVIIITAIANATCLIGDCLSHSQMQNIFNV